MKKSDCYYLHTLDGKPAAFFVEDGLVCFSNKVRLCASLRQLRKEQRISMKNEPGRHNFTYGYQRVTAPHRPQGSKQ